MAFNKVAIETTSLCCYRNLGFLPHKLDHSNKCELEHYALEAELDRLS
jgi:hypothetical protein